MRVRELWSRLRGTFDRAADAEVEEELAFHIDMAVQRNLSRGLTPEAARREALLHLGGLDRTREAARDVQRSRRLEGALQDVRYAARVLVRAPAFALAVVLTLALGIGVNAAIFTVLDRLYLRPPAGIAAPDAMRRVWIENFRANGEPFASQHMTYPMYRVLLAAGAGELALHMTPESQRLGPEAGAPRARVVHASANFVEVLGLRPGRGRFYTPEEDRLGAGAQVAVISDAFWRRHFDGAADVVGRTMRVGTREFTVIGVMARAFTGLDLQAADLWLPLGALEAVPPGGGDWWESPNVFFLRAVGRMNDAAAEARFAERATTLMRAANRERDGQRADTLMNVLTGSIIEARGPGRPGQEQQISLRVAGVSVLVLLIACANVINLLLARAVRRRRENAVRVALGISRWRMLRLVTAETLLLAGLAGAVALVAASWGGSLLRSLLLPDIEWVVPTLDLRVALFTGLVTLAAGLVAGVVPALQTRRTDLIAGLKAGVREGVRQRSKLRTGLVMAQAALSVVLLVGALLFVRSLQNVQQLDIGYDADRTITAQLEFPVGETPPAALRAATLRDVAQRLETRPEFEAVARTSTRPMSGRTWLQFYTGLDSLASFAPTFPTTTAVSPSYFRTVGLRILRGRGFQSTDVDGAPGEVVVNDAMARLVWPGREPLGQCMRFETRAGPCHTVVGIVENARLDQIIEEAPAPQYYVPLAASRSFSQGTSLLVRAAPDRAAAAAAILRAELRQAFPTALPSATSMLEYLDPQYRPWRLGATLFTAFGLLALLVALVGIYTTVSYGVSQRTHEFGVRMALGARVGTVVRQVVAEELRTVVAGVIAGIALALAAGRLVEALLYGVRPNDPQVLTFVALGLIFAASAAALLPAWRAAHTDPLTTLRSE